jgi:hypothetical protein
MRRWTPLLLLTLLLAGASPLITAQPGGAGRVYLPLVRGGSAGQQPQDEQPVAVVNPDAVLIPGPISFPDGFMLNVRTYGAKGDGVTDDTAAIQRALDDERVDAEGRPLYPVPDQYNGRPRALYFPAGTYLVRDTLRWVGCCLTLQGQGPGVTQIRLAPGTAAFGDPSNPRPVIQTESGNMSFRQNIWDLAISVGPGNPGAIGLDYIANNSGAVRNVLIRSEDGRGVAGLELMRKWPGPNMFSHLRIEGFDYGVRTQFIEYSQTYENLVLVGQRVAGIRNAGAVLAIRGLYSDNRVPVLVNADEHGLVALLDGRFNGGDAANSAIELRTRAGNVLYLRNVAATGYRSLVRDDGVASSSLRADEYFSGATVYSLFNQGTSTRSLRLPVRNTPSFHDPDLGRWAVVRCNGYVGCQLSSELQGLLNSGKATVAFPAGVRIAYDELVVMVPASVRRIVGFMGVINGGGRGGGGVRFVVEGDSTEPLIIEQFGYGVRVEHRGRRPVVLKYGQFTYVSRPGAGDLYAEDAQLDGFVIQQGQRLWGRQINNERRDGTKILNDGGTLWILGMKTEGRHTVIDTRNGGRSEYLGGLLYPAEQLMEPGEIAFRLSGGAQASLLYSNIVFGTRNYDLQVREERSGVTRELATNATPGRTRLYVSRN